jgi:hypothetical protein
MSKRLGQNQKQSADFSYESPEIQVNFNRKNHPKVVLVFLGGPGQN